MKIINFKNFLKDDKAILNPILDCMFSLALIVILYYMLMPLLWYISNTLISMGAPAASTLFYLKLANWGFVIFAAAALIVLVAKIYRKTHDTERLF